MAENHPEMLKYTNALVLEAYSLQAEKVKKEPTPKLLLVLDRTSKMWSLS